MARTTKLNVLVFGDGSAGELGLGPKNATDVKRPRLNTNLDADSIGVVALAAGGMHAAALTHDGKIFTWGVNDHRALGRDTDWDGDMKDVDVAEDASDTSEPGLNPQESIPTAIPADKFPTGTRIVQITAANSATFALTDDGQVYGWGTFRVSLYHQQYPNRPLRASQDSNGVFGFSLTSNNEIIEIQREPVPIPALKNITMISAGSDYVLALDAEGTIFAWGDGEQNQLGHRITPRRRNNSLTPTLSGLPKKKFVSIHAASNHGFAIDRYGDTWAWGLNNFGQTGISTGAGKGGATINPPRKVPSLVGKRMKMVQGGSHHSIGITQDGECLVWGRIDSAQLGMDTANLPLDDAKKVIVVNGRPRVLLEPTPLPITGVVYAAAGSDHNIVITAEGKAYSWGFNVNYQCGQGTSDDVIEVKLIDNTASRGMKFTWAGAGGQYSILAAPCAANEDVDMADA